MNDVRVWRLVVELPEGVGWANPPQAWLDWRAEVEQDWGSVDPNAPEINFSWPQRRNFLSRGAALRMAERLRSYGATVTVERSDPVTFTHTTPDQEVSS
jgi:hypothetical protein